MLHHLPREVVITIAAIVSFFGICLLCMCGLLRASSSSITLADRQETDDDEEAASSKACGCCASMRRCCCCSCCKSDRASRIASRRQFSSIHALLYEIDEDETARVVVAASPYREADRRHEDEHDDHRQASTTTDHFIDVSMDLMFPDILYVPKYSADQHPQNTSARSGSSLDEPLL
jgi:hypothetical protein